jgi:cellulose synthase/poly-beta-1,6-N-acetylglucosamine synthase-like glycosyltransferase/thioredoxin-like negative regulator of GroEL
MLKDGLRPLATVGGGQDIAGRQSENPTIPQKLERSDDPAIPGFLEKEVFFQSVDGRFQGATKRGTLAVVEIQNYSIADAIDRGGVAKSSADIVYVELLHLISAAIGRDDVFCWHDNRFILLFGQSQTAHQMLRRIARQIAKCSFHFDDAPAFLTPVIGYVDLRKTATADELWQSAEITLDCANSSLDMVPLRYVRKLKANGPGNPGAKLTRLRPIPQSIRLLVQLALTLVIGLGAPFILYAVCDALGADISGPVYIGVVAVLVITASTIWIESILALKRTLPPHEPSSPFPPATVIIPAYLPNEAATIIDTLNAFLRVGYPNVLQIIIAYNSPTHLPIEDELVTFAASPEHAGRFIIEPVRVANSSSKAQNVNAVIGRVRGDFVGIFDADHHPRPGSFQRAWRWLSNGWDIVQGRCSIRNGADSWVSRMVAIEFEQIYAVSHPGRARFHGFGIFGGSNGFWRTAVLHETRMYNSMLTEDIDSSIRAIAAGYKIVSDRDLVSEELAPTTLRPLLIQRLRWAQGWFQVSWRRIVPALSSPRVSLKQKVGLVHLLVWREMFPWYSIQVVPILGYWVWAYGWGYINWAVPIFLGTTVFTLSSGLSQILFAFVLADKQMRHKKWWFLEYCLMSTFFFAPFKDALSRIAHLKELMRERAWRVTPRSTLPSGPSNQLAKVFGSIVILLIIVLLPGRGLAQENPEQHGLSKKYLTVLVGGEVSTINAARLAAKDGRNADAAKLFNQAIDAVPARRDELLHEYADALSYANRSAEAVPLYRELLARSLPAGERIEITAQLALALTWSTQYQAALTVYDNMLAEAPEDADVAVHRARVLAWLGRPDDAVAALDRVAPEKWATGSLGILGDEVLVDAARSAAKVDENAASANLFDRAIRHNAALRSSLLREYADQLVYSDRPADAIPLYHEVIDDKRTSIADRTEADLGLAQALLNIGLHKDASNVYASALKEALPGTDAYERAQRGLSLALTWANAPVQALESWRDYLKAAPSDADAIVHEAQVYSALGQNEEALDAYKKANAIDHQNVAAKRGIVDETIKLARIAAQDDKNVESAALFATAINLDSRRRGDLLREYADQLSFSGSSTEAIPLYREVLTATPLSTVDRKRAMKGLADAYVWAGRSEEALEAYDDLVRAFPDDAGIQWSKLVLEARQAAQANRNKESADLFAQAIGIDSVSSTGILREYADQLSFSDRASDAISIYLQVLSQPNLADPDRLLVQKGLAQAYDWSGRQAEAKSVYNDLIKEYPNDDSLKWDMIVTSAHEAAKADRNKEAASLFAEAIQLLPAQRDVILKEYADQLSFSDHASSAIPLYLEVLNRPALTESDQLSADKGLAQAYDWSHRPSDAKSIYSDLVKKYPDDVSLQWGLLVFSAHKAAQEDQNKEAANFLAEAIRLFPTKRSLILKEYADKLTFSGDAKEAIPLYRETIAQGGKAADIRDEHLGLALALSWDSQLTAALNEYQNLVSTDPDDIDAGNGVARVLSWSGRQSDAETAYRRILSLSPNNPEAQRGLAQVEDWQGHHRLAQAVLAQRLTDDPDDLDARRLLAQSLYWMGRPDKAMDELKLALKPKQAQDVTNSLQQESSDQPPETVTGSLAPQDGGLLQAGLQPFSVHSVSP